MIKINENVNFEVFIHLRLFAIFNGIFKRIIGKNDQCVNQIWCSVYLELQLLTRKKYKRLLF